ncbi:translocation protein TolB [compost metagenome]
MKHLIGMALGATLFLGGCEGSPLQLFMNETFGAGRHLETNAFVQEIAPGLPFPSPTVTISPDGSRYAYSIFRENGRLYVGQSGQGAGPLDLYSQQEPSWSPDGRRMAFVEAMGSEAHSPRRSLTVIDLDSKAVTRLAEGNFGYPLKLAWSPDGSTVLYSSDQDDDGLAESLYRVSVTTPNPQRIAEVGSNGMDGSPALWSPDGKQIAYLAKIPGFLNAFNLMIVTVADESTKVLRRVPRGKSLVWSTDGEAIGYLDGDGASGEFAFHRIRLSDGAEEVTPFTLGKPTAVVHESGLEGWVGFHISDLSPDHRFCIVNHGQDPLYARELATGKHIQLTDSQAWVRGWTADSKAILATASKGSVARYYRIQVER